MARKTVAWLVAFAFLGPVGWRVGGEWGLALAAALLFVAANVWGGGAPPERD
jgi:hypothetical protein